MYEPQPSLTMMTFRKSIAPGASPASAFTVYSPCAKCGRPSFSSASNAPVGVAEGWQQSGPPAAGMQSKDRQATGRQSGGEGKGNQSKQQLAGSLALLQASAKNSRCANDGRMPAFQGMWQWCAWWERRRRQQAAAAASGSGGRIRRHPPRQAAAPEACAPAAPARRRRRSAEGGLSSAGCARRWTQRRPERASCGQAKQPGN